MTHELPADVVDTDRRLQRSADELMELRWHWTLDETNADRVGFTEYGRQVGKAESTIRMDARAWESWQRSEDSHDIARIPEPGAPQTPSDYRELSKLRSDRQEAAQAIAKASGQTVSNVAANRRDDIDTVLANAAERAERRGTMPEAELGDVAAFHESGRRAAKQQSDRRKRAHSMAFLSAEGKVARMIRTGNEILVDSAGVEFTDDERELLAASVAKLRALLHLLDARFAGDVDVDWDAELAKLGGK